MTILSAERIQAGLGTTLIGQQLVYMPATGSTNDEARRLAQAGASDGTLVVTDYQAVGRGRLQRRWDAPAGSSLLISLIFRPLLRPQQAQRLTMLCALSAADAIKQQTGLRVALKWPNDLLLSGGKVGGILTEIEVRGDQLDYAVVGLGLNVNLDPSELPGDLLMDATSLSHALGRKVARLPLLKAFLRTVEKRYLNLKAGHSPLLEWSDRLETLGQLVSVPVRDVMVEGVAEAVDDSGALLLRLSDGRLLTVRAGDVLPQFGKRRPDLL